VVLNSNSPVLEAARAIESNNIGAVVVQEKGRIVGIVTDRDLAIRVVGQGRDPRTTLISEMMSTPVTTLTPADRQSDALRLMRQRNIRRIPLIDAGQLVGMVTLDDLVLDEAAPLEQIATVVQGQIGEGGPAASSRSPAEQRRAARARATYGRLLNRVRMQARLESVEQAETALEVVLESLVRRLTPDEAEDLVAQLPSLLQPTLRAQALGPDRDITRETIEAELCERLDVAPPRAAEILNATGATVADIVSPGQVQDMRSQLPEHLRGILSGPVPVGS
jgi:uncharacterized protein (DUF2267 family)/predicted transcriptional regulator